MNQLGGAMMNRSRRDERGHVMVEYLIVSMLSAIFIFIVLTEGAPFDSRAGQAAGNVDVPAVNNAILNRQINFQNNLN